MLRQCHPLRWLRNLRQRALRARRGRRPAHRRELPPDFDWRAYLERYPDLRRAGLDTEAAAIRHWLEFGAAEGRWGTAPSYPTRSTLVCPSVHSIYLRATGNLVCWDDAGNDRVLRSFDDRVHYGRDVYLGPVFNAVRQRLWAGALPFEVCRRCLVLRCRTEHSSYHLDQRVVELFQVEPSYKCSLDCPGCVPLAVRRLAPPRNLDPTVFGKILDDLVDARVEVRAFDFQGHGEPLLHPRLWQLTRMARAAYPRSYLTVSTNAHGVVDDDALASGIDEIVCGIDGVDQATYVPYRVNGRFDLAYRFLRDLATRSKQQRAGIKVIWKYVLFAHNSAREHLLEVQRLAAAAAADELVFVFTRNGPRSETVTRPADVPVLGGGVPISFRYHEPAVDDLESRLAEAGESFAAGAEERAGELAASVACNLGRFFPDRGALTPAHRRLRDQLVELAAELPAAPGEEIAAGLGHLAE